MQIVPSQDVIGAVIEGVDLAQPLSDAEFSRIEADRFAACLLAAFAVAPGRPPPR